MHRLLFLFVAFSLASGCAPVLTDDFAQELTESGGCADVVFYAVDDSNQILLIAQGEGLIAAAEERGEAEFVTSFELPDAALQVQVETGTRIADAMCTDVIINGGPTVLRTYSAVSGTATVTVRLGDESADARADLSLEAVIVEPVDGGAQVALGSIEITDVGVGWFAG